jgi:acetylornithine/succinyldiaminopimelate/putrescine aminotransferase
VWSLAVLPDDQQATLSAVELTNWADQVLKKRLENVRGVGSVSLVGGTKREINIYLKPQAMEAYGITTDQVVNAVKSENQNLPVGAIRSLTQERVVQIDARMQRPEDFGKIIISRTNAYHGSTHGALSVMGNEEYKQAYRPLLPDIRFIQLNKQEQLAHITANTAAVILESIQGEAGIRVPDKAYMQALRKRCTETGTLLILDEIQAGFGRTGKLFAFEHFNIVPDVVLLAKSMGGGMPIGAFVAAKEVMDVLKDNPILGHITTFGGHPVSCAAGLASLTALLEENLIAGVAAKEALFRKLLVHPKIKEIRGKGLMLCIEVGDFELVHKVASYCQEHGLIIDWFLHCSTALRIAPPLIIGEPEIEEACSLLLEALDKA